ncbi:MAG: hybrid sensor histidine kinase/response regulator [Leptolyngbyaceae cyanobacterium SM1_4_3]|nr:hybrid sensor histidine kinase/response regulator [Leptolyngbyaceae cyanobacterium SM1_4_3]NJN89852.1 hybrid sensor histidine kinase/response regulator [Leptolyngbyaceae cyanobacterium SL_5_14]
MEKTIVQILLVEDSSTDANLLRQAFLRANRQDWNLSHVDRLSYAIDACCDRPFDVVLLDLHLPDSNGLETITEFRAALPDLAIIVLTATDDEELALQSMANGAQDYLVKDQITIQLLVRSIRYAIEREQILKRLKNSEQNMLKALNQERELNLIRTNFISMVSHEFRTPMTTIRSSAELLQCLGPQIKPEKREQYFDRIQTSIDQMLNLLDEVLLLGSSGAGGLECKPAPLDLENFCLELVEAMQFNDSDRHIITFTHQGDCVSAEMDVALLRHIFVNLIANAIKYSPAGTHIQFDLNCQNNVATFLVQDQGIGIPAKDQNRLFETFYRCSNVGKISGTGLGLAIVRRCIDLHQGKIQFTSQIDVGTQFTVTLPLKPIPTLLET